MIEGFRFDGPPVRCEPVAGGHIHRNLLVTGTVGRYVVQRINRRVFPDVDAVMANTGRIVGHLHARGRVAPTLVETHQGRLWLQAADGSAWRAFRFLEGTVGRDLLAGPTDTFEAGRAFSDYVAALSDLPGPPLATTIDAFHDLDHRRDAHDAAAAADPVGRADGVRRQLGRARRLAQVVADAFGARTATSPVRTVHNDAKLSNVRFDAETGSATCVVDLDTTMPGSVLYDVGELMRSTTTHAPEDADEADVDFDLELLDALSAGYFSSPLCLEASEVGAMALAGPRMAVENGLRFLTDHLAGDRYFAVHRVAQNLDRCRAHLRLTELMLASAAASEASFVRAARQSGPA